MLAFCICGEWASGHGGCISEGQTGRRQCVSPRPRLLGSGRLPKRRPSAPVSLVNMRCRARATSGAWGRDIAWSRRRRPGGGRSGGDGKQGRLHTWRSALAQTTPLCMSRGWMSCRLSALWWAIPGCRFDPQRRVVVVVVSMRPSNIRVWVCCIPGSLEEARHGQHYPQLRLAFAGLGLRAAWGPRSHTRGA